MPTIWLSRSAFEFMVTEATVKSPNESGGVLLGYWVTPWTEAVIVRAVGPGPNAVHLPSSFSPDGKYHWAEIETEYMATGGCHTYLGDWHTHPSGGAFLSARDFKTLRKIANDPESQTSHPLMLILHSNETTWEGTAWKWIPNYWKRVLSSRAENPLGLKLF